MKSENLRYIIFAIDSKEKQHDGKIFASYQEAKEYAADLIADKFADKTVIGMFHIDKDSKEMFISQIETIGFAGDKKNVNQLNLFSQS
jgi:hypothetical protein